jgi:hypothetical protein
VLGDSGARTPRTLTHILSAWLALKTSLMITLYESQELI